MSHKDNHSEIHNPYASPPMPAVEAEPVEFDGFGALEAKAFVGPRYHYDFVRRTPFLRRTTSTAGFNWAAFFLSGFWIPYRKMYRLTVVFYAVIVLETIVEEVGFRRSHGNGRAAGSDGDRHRIRHGSNLRCVW